MTTVLIILLVQAVLGAADNLFHHELQARLPARWSARRELALHAAREAIYGIVFLALAWTVPTGFWTWGLVGLLAVEIVITAADFLEEDRTRQLPPAERVLHLVLAVSYGVLLGALVPHLVDWTGQPTALQPADYGLISWLLSVCAIGVIAWSARNALAALRIQRPLPSTASDRHSDARARTFLVTGGTGFIGSALVAALAREGHRLIVLTRDPKQARAQFGASVTAIDRLDDLPSETRIDAVVNLAGAAIFGMPWSKGRRRTLMESRTNVTMAVNSLIGRLEHKPTAMVSASAVGFYGHGDDAPIDETAPAQAIFSSRLCQQREETAGIAEQWGVRCVFLRFGLVLGHGGGVLPPMTLASRLGCGAILGDGRQPMPWIHLDDAIGLVRFAIETPALRGAVNATAPETPRQAVFARSLARTVRRPLLLRVPAGLLKTMLGEQSELLLRGRVVRPTRATKAGYRFRHPQVDGALADLVGHRVNAPSRTNSSVAREPKGQGDVVE